MLSEAIQKVQSYRTPQQKEATELLTCKAKMDRSIAISCINAKRISMLH
jgi:hypothetical protein